MIHGQEVWVNAPDDLDDLGEHFVGVIITTFEELVERFGDPMDLDYDPRGDVIWLIEQAGGAGLKATIYNYKGTLSAPEVGETRFWHVDSRNGHAALGWLRGLVPGNERLEVPPAQGPYRITKVERSTIFKNITSAAGNTIGWVCYDGGEVPEEQRVAQSEAQARAFASVDVLAEALLALHVEFSHEVGFGNGFRRLEEIVSAAYLRARGRPIDEAVPDERFVT